MGIWLGARWVVLAWVLWWINVVVSVVIGEFGVSLFDSFVSLDSSRLVGADSLSCCFFSFVAIGLPFVMVSCSPNSQSSRFTLEDANSPPFVARPPVPFFRSFAPVPLSQTHLRRHLRNMASPCRLDGRHSSFRRDRSDGFASESREVSSTSRRFFPSNPLHSLED